MPRTWQGWVYTLVAVGVLVLIQALPWPSENVRTAAMGIYVLIFALDIAHIMIVMPRDERERLHEAIAERNALWAMIAALTIGVGYQVAVSIVRESVQVDPVILIALGAALIAKAATNVYLERHD